jgi:hypothetical protein
MARASLNSLGYRVRATSGVHTLLRLAYFAGSTAVRRQEDLVALRREHERAVRTAVGTYGHVAEISAGILVAAHTP